MDEGRIVEEGAPEAFFEGAKSQRVKEFVDKILRH
jgi:polar amino acid transport system ATP-binding protein